MTFVATIVAVSPACSTNSSSSGDIPTSSSDGTPTASTSPFPPRPREISMNGVDPCTDVLTEAQQREFGLNRPPRSIGSDERGSPACLYPHSYSEPYYDYFFAPVTSEGAEAWVTSDRIIDKRVIEVAGFGAVEHTLLGGPDSDCTVSVDVASGQSFDVSFGGSSSDFSSEQMCERAQAATVAALETLSAR